jgi:enolase
MEITHLRLRGILDSRGCTTVEAEMVLDGRYTGSGSTPRAIAPGRRERPRGPGVRLGRFFVPELAGAVLRQQVTGQRELDDLVTGIGLGSDVALAVSLAFARAAAEAARRDLCGYLSDLAGTRPAMPRLLVNVFSGGIHTGPAPDGFQQVMLIPATGALAGDIAVALAVFEQAEREVTARFGAPVLSASSGLRIPVDSTEQLVVLQAAIAATGYTGVTSIGVDVAAEHLVDRPGRYRFAGEVLDSTEFAKRLAGLAARFPLTYVEDPFDPADVVAWRMLRGILPPGVTVVGDDLFATDAHRVDATLAHGILLKPSQAGTVTATLDAARTSREAGLFAAVSHRSGETEDTAICDLGVALAAQLIKVGGPRRGDRVAKYNQLLRLTDAVL